MYHIFNKFFFVYFFFSLSHTLARIHIGTAQTDVSQIIYFFSFSLFCFTDTALAYEHHCCTDIPSVGPTALFSKMQTWVMVGFQHHISLEMTTSIFSINTIFKNLEEKSEFRSTAIAKFNSEQNRSKAVEGSKLAAHLTVANWQHVEAVNRYTLRVPEWATFKHEIRVASVCICYFFFRRH